MKTTMLLLLSVIIGFSSCSKDGAVGPQGPIGPKGAKGDSGSRGLSGPAGAMGPQGAAGATGPAGAMGPAGVPGTNGAPGAMGATGPAGTANVIADSVTVLTAMWSPSGSSNTHTYVFLSSKLTQARLRGGAVVVSMNVPGQANTFTLPYIPNAYSYYYLMDPGTITFVVANQAAAFTPGNLSFRFFIIPLPGVAYAKAHGINLNSYDDVKKGFNL